MEQQALTLEDIAKRLDELQSIALIGAKPILNVREAALFLGYSEQTLYKKTSQGQIPHYKQGTRVYFVKSELIDWMTRERRLSNQELEQIATTKVVLNPMRQ